MNEIQGLGPTQPLRSAAPANRPNMARPSAQNDSPSSFGSDDVQVSCHSPVSPSPAVEPEPSTPQVQVAAPTASESPRVEEVDGFIVAGAPQATSSASRCAEVDRTFGSGPIAVIDEPSPALIPYPELALNGPSTAASGLFSLAGNRLA